MRRLRGALLLALALALLVPVGTSAFAFSDRYYVGHTSPGKKLLFVVSHTDSGDLFKPSFVTWVDTCEDGLTVTVQFGFQGFAEPIDEHGRFDLDLPSYPSDHLRWRGRITRTGATGRLFHVFAAITVDDQAQLCGTLVRWTARALKPAAAAKGSGGAQVSIEFVRKADGTVTMTRRSAGVATTAATRPG